jgi:nitroreductase
MLLKAHSLGLGTLWIGDVFYARDALENYLDKHRRLTAAVALGWPAETPKPRPRKTIEEVAEFLAD